MGAAIRIKMVWPVRTAIPFSFIDTNSVAADGTSGLATGIAGEQRQIPIAVYHSLHVVGSDGLKGRNRIAEGVSLHIGEFDLRSNGNIFQRCKMMGIVVGADDQVILVYISGKAAGGNLQPFVIPAVHHRQGKLQRVHIQHTNVLVTVQQLRGHFPVLGNFRKKMVDPQTLGCLFGAVFGFRPGFGSGLLRCFLREGFQNFTFGIPPGWLCGFHQGFPFGFHSGFPFGFPLDVLPCPLCLLPGIRQNRLRGTGLTLLFRRSPKGWDHLFQGLYRSLRRNVRPMGIPDIVKRKQKGCCQQQQSDCNQDRTLFTHSRHFPFCGSGPCRGTQDLSAPERIRATTAGRSEGFSSRCS